MLMCLRSVRDGDFEMYVDIQDQFAPWMFMLDHTHYARWLPVYIQSLNILHQQQPEVYKQFLKGRFTRRHSVSSPEYLPTKHIITTTK